MYIWCVCTYIYMSEVHFYASEGTLCQQGSCSLIWCTSSDEKVHSAAQSTPEVHSDQTRSTFFFCTRCRNCIEIKYIYDQYIFPLLKYYFG